MLERLGPPPETISEPERTHTFEKAREILSETGLQLLGAFTAMENSPEGKARTLLMQRLKELRADSTIAQSETCIELIDAFHACLDYRFMARDSGSVIDFLAFHFDKERAAAAGRAKAQRQAEEDRPYREFLAMHAGEKPNAQKTLLRNSFGMKADAAHAVVRRWRESEECKKLTAASTRTPPE